MVPDKKEIGTSTLTALIYISFMTLFLLALSSHAFGQSVAEELPVDCKALADAGHWETSSPPRVYADNDGWINATCEIDIGDVKYLQSSIQSMDPLSDPPYREVEDHNYAYGRKVNSGSVWQTKKWFEIECFWGKTIVKYVGGTNTDTDKTCNVF